MDPSHPNLRWYSTENGAFLDYNAGCVAYVRPSGRVILQAWGDFREIESASQDAGIAIVEDWVSRQTGFPGMGRAGRSK